MVFLRKFYIKNCMNERLLGKKVFLLFGIKAVAKAHVHDSEVEEVVVHVTELRRQIQRLQWRMQIYESHGAEDIVDDFNPIMGIPEFDGKIQPYEFLYWLSTIERSFDCHDTPEHRRVKLVAIKLKKNASFRGKKIKEATGKRRKEDDCNLKQDEM